MCFGCSKEPPHRDGSFEYPQHMFWLGMKNNFLLRSFIWGPGKLSEMLFQIPRNKQAIQNHAKVISRKLAKSWLELSGISMWFKNGNV